jgi:hypothetical protein
MSSKYLWNVYVILCTLFSMLKNSNNIMEILVLTVKLRSSVHTSIG